VGEDTAPGGGAPQNDPDPSGDRGDRVPPPPPGAVPPDGPSRRRPWPWVVAWGVAVAIVAALVVPALVVTEAAGRVTSDDLERYVPLDPGSTWVYASRTDGKDTGRVTEQVSGRALVEALAPNTVVVSDNFANFVGTGTPRTVLTYYGLKEDRLVRFGVRSNNQFQQTSPPEVILRLPLEKGATWRWRGERLGGKGDSVVTVLDVADRRVLGRTFPHCVHLRTTGHDTSSQGSTSADVTDTWQCPEVGLVRLRETFRSGTQTLRFAEDLVEAHVPGLNLWRGGPPAAETSTPAEQGSTSAVDQGHSGYAAGAQLSTDHLAWSVARREGILYPPVGAGDDLVLAEDDGTVSSMNVRTGAVGWQVGLSGPIVASPVVAGDVVLVADSSKALWGLDRSDGTTRWVVRLPDVVSATPAVEGETIVAPTDDLVVRGLDLATGEQRWAGTSSALVIAPPVVAQGLVVVGDQAGNLTAFRSDGSVAWSDSSIVTFSGGISQLGGLAAGGDLVVASTDSSTMFAYDARTGDVRWRAQAPSTVDRAAAVAGDRVVVASDETVEVRDAAAGGLVWRRSTDTTFAPPMVIGDTVAVLETDNRLLAFDLATGTERAVPIGTPDATASQSTSLPLALAGGALVVATHNLGPWPFTILQGFSAAAGGAAPSLGVRPEGEAYLFDTAPSGPGSLRGRVLYTPGTVFSGDTAVNHLFEVSPGGPLHSPTRSLYTARSSLDYAIAAGDRVVTQSGKEIIGVPVSGGRPWSATGGQPLPGTRPIVAGETVIVPDPQVGISGLDVSTGRRAWPTVSPPSPNGLGSPVELPDGDVVWGVGAITVIDPRTGKVVRQRKGLSAAATLAPDGGHLVGLVSIGTNTVIASFEAGSLRPEWAQPFSPAMLFGLVAIAPAAGDGIVAAVDSSNVLHGLDESTGTEAWSLRLRVTPNSPPVVWDGRVYVEEPGLPENLDQREHRITVLDARTGAFEGQWEPAGVNFYAGAFTRSADRLLVPLPGGVLAVHPEGR
jgi:outer membrane protein assembly factor BamB